MESKNFATSKKRNGRRGSLFRSSSTGSVLDAADVAAPLQGKKVSIDKAVVAYAAMDDIGVSGGRNDAPIYFLLALSNIAGYAMDNATQLNSTQWITCIQCNLTCSQIQGARQPPW